MAGLSKQEIRREWRKKKTELSPEYCREASRQIAEKVLSLPEWKQAGSVMVYVPMEGEPDTRELITTAVRTGKRVLLPRCADRTRMEAAPFTGWERMKESTYGIPEPTGEATAEKPELILIPCVAATATGTRLGHGAGYYDRFLQNQPGCRVCLCFDTFLTEQVPAEEWDIPMEKVITEKEIYDRREDREENG